jgi:hypothetical protein
MKRICLEYVGLVCALDLFLCFSFCASALLLSNAHPPEHVAVLVALCLFSTRMLKEGTWLLRHTCSRSSIYGQLGAQSLVILSREDSRLSPFYCRAGSRRPPAFSAVARQEEEFSIGPLAGRIHDLKIEPHVLYIRFSW